MVLSIYLVFTFPNQTVQSDELYSESIHLHTYHYFIINPLVLFFLASGRTGRAGRSGRAITFFTESDSMYLRRWSIDSSLLIKYCKQIFICVREMIAMFVRAPSSIIFLTTNHSLSYGYNKNRHDE